MAEKAMGGKKEKGKRKSRVKLLANWGHCTYATEIVWKQHAKLSRLKKPDNGKRTSEACKETGQRRWKENSIAIKRTKETGIRVYKYLRSQKVRYSATGQHRPANLVLLAPAPRLPTLPPPPRLSAPPTHGS